MTALPPIYYLHVWWARRPLVASRAAVLASILPADADRDRFLHAIGIHGDPVASRRRIDAARRRGERFEGQAYSYARAFKYSLEPSVRDWMVDAVDGNPDGLGALKVLDPTAGGGSIPFETLRLGLDGFANDLNPVAALVMNATIRWPRDHGIAVKHAFSGLAQRYVAERDRRLAVDYPAEPSNDSIPTNYLWARTVRCPYCEGLVPLSPNWRLGPDGTGVRVVPHLGEGPGSAERVCSFEIVESVEEQSGATVSRGSGMCPYDDCGRVIEGEAIKEQAQSGGMGEHLYAVVYKQRVEYRTKAGKRRWKWVRGYRAPRPDDENADAIDARLAEKMPEWEALDCVPSERIPDGAKTVEPQRYGMTSWRNLFSARQLLCHGTSVEVFREMPAVLILAFLLLFRVPLVFFRVRRVGWGASRVIRVAGRPDRRWRAGPSGRSTTGTPGIRRGCAGARTGGSGCRAAAGPAARGLRRVRRRRAGRRRAG